MGRQSAWGPPTLSRNSTNASHRPAAAVFFSLLPFSLPLPVADNVKYAPSHEWAKLEGDTVTVGISDHAQVRV